MGFVNLAPIRRCSGVYFVSRKVLLLYNSPKARRYFEALRDNIPELNLPVRWVGVKGGEPISNEQRAAITRYTMIRKEVRYTIPQWKMRLLRRLHEHAAQWHYNASRAKIEAEKPDAIGVWGGQSVDVKAAITAAADLGVPSYVFECGLLPRTTTCDARGVNYDNSVPRDPAFYESYSAEAELPTDLLQRASVQQYDAVELPEKYIFVPFQVRLDSQVLLYSPWVRDMRHLYDLVSDVAAEALAGTGVKLVLKQHPSCPETYPELHYFARNCAHLMFANGNNTQQILQQALGVITVNSTVGIEALLMGRPVMTLGQACYGVPGVATPATSVSQLRDWMQSIASGSVPGDPLRQPFLNYLANEYVIPDTHKAPGPQHFAAIHQRLSSHPGLVDQANCEASQFALRVQEAQL